jgi:hypothetical protein
MGSAHAFLWSTFYELDLSPRDDDALAGLAE